MPTAPNLDEYGAATQAAYSTTSSGGLVLPPGLTLLRPSDASQLSDGFSAVAFKDASGNIIIAYDGTQFSTNSLSYSAGTGIADALIENGQTPQALLDAQAFAKQIQQQYDSDGLSQIYVTGHSLGGTEAEAACQVLGSNCAGGATFGATGLPGNTASGPTTLINYVDWGDPVGNYASDSNSAFNSIAPTSLYHFGQVVMVGSQSDATPLLNAATDVQNAINPNFNYDGSNPTALILAGLSNVFGGLKYHSTDNYANDLLVPELYSPPGTDNDPDALPFFLSIYGLPLGNVGAQNSEDSTVTINGTVTSINSPDLNISYNSANNEYSIDASNSVTGSSGVVLTPTTTAIVGDLVTGATVTVSGINALNAAIAYTSGTFSVSTSSDTVDISANAQATITGNNNTLSLGTGGNVTVSGTAQVDTSSTGAIDVQAPVGTATSLTTLNNTLVDIVGANRLTYDPVSGEYLIDYNSGGSTSVSASLNASGQGTATATGANGQSTSTTVANWAGLYTTVGSAFGSSLGRIIAGSNSLTQIAVSTTLGTTLGDVVTLLENTGDLAGAFNGVVGSFATSIEAGGAGAVSSYLFAQVVTSLGITGLPADVLDTFGGHAVSIIASNLVNSLDPITGEALNSAGNPIAGTGNVANNLSDIANWELVGAQFVGSEIASAIYQPSTPQGSEGAAVASAVGNAVAAYIILQDGTVEGVLTLDPVEIAAAAVAAILDYVLGGVIGDLFGQPSMSQIAEANFTTSVSSSGLLSFTSGTTLYQGGPIDDANAAGEVVTSTLNDILAAVGGTVANVSSLTSFGVGFNTDAAAGYDSGFHYSSAGMAYYYFDNTAGTNPQFWAADTPFQTIVDYAVMRELSEMVFSAGDPYMERAIDAALRSPDVSVGQSEYLVEGSNLMYVPSASTLSGYIQVAQDYETYEANRATINALIEANPTSSYALNWISELTLAGSMGFGTSVQGGTDDDTLGIVQTTDPVTGAVTTDRILIGGGGDDTYVVNQGDGNVTILNGVSYNNAANGILDFNTPGLYYTFNSTNALNPGTTNLTFTGNGADLIIGDGIGDNVTLKGWFAGSFAELNQINLANGTIIGLYYMQLAVGQERQTQPYPGVYVGETATDIGIEGANSFTNSSNAIAGGDGQDVLAGGSGANNFITGGGADIAYGGGGADEYQLDAPGQLTIYNNETETGTVIGSSASGSLVFGAASGGTLNQLSFSESGNDLVINIASDGGQVTVKNWFAAGYAQLSSILTADGYTISYANGVFSTGPSAVDWIVTNGSVLNANSLFVNVAAGISATVNGSYNNIQAVNDALTIAGADGTVDTIGGSGDAITVTSAGDTFYLSGANQTITTYDNGATIDIAAGSTVTVGGNYNTINVAAGATVATRGTGNVITATGDVLTIGGPNGFTEVIGGSGDSIAVASASDTIDLSGTSQTLTTTYATTINVGSNTSATITGNNDTITGAAGATTSVYGSGDVLTLTGNNTIGVGSGTSVTISNDVPGDVVNIYNNDAATVTGTGGYIGIVGTGVSLAASGENIGAYPGASFTLTGNNNTITDDAGAITYLYGSGNVLMLSGGDAIAVGSGTGVTIDNDVSGDIVNIYNNNNVATVTGTGGYIGVVGTGIDLAASGETIGVSAGASFALWGNNDTITGASGASIDIERGTGDVVNATNDTIILAAGASVTINNNGTGGVLDFGAGITANQLIFGQSGNDLVIDVAGSSTQAIIKNWFSTASARLLSIDTSDGQQLSFVSTGTNFFTVGETDLFFRDAATGQLSVWRDDGVTAGGQSLTTGGAPFTIDAATTVVGTASNLYAQSGQDILFRNGAGTVSFAEFTSGGAEFGGGETLYNATVNLTVDSTAEFVGTNGTNFMSQGGHDLFIRGDGNQLLVWEFNNNTGQVVAGEYLYQSNGTPFTIDTATAVIGVGSNLLGQDGHDILTRNADNTVSITEFNSSGYAIVGGTFTYQGNALTMENAARFVGTNGTNFLGQYGYDLFFRYATGQLLVWEVANGTAQITSGQYLLQPNGNGPYTIDTATTVIGVGSNLLGYNGQDILTHHGPETVSITEFDSNGDEITSSMLTYNGNNLTFDAETQFVGTNGMNFLDAGGHDLFFRYSTGQVVIWEYTSGTSQVTAGGYLYQSDGVTPFTIDTATTIVGVGSNLLGHGGQDVLLRNAGGTVSVDEFNSNGAELGSVSLYYPGVNLTVDNTAEYVGTNSTNFMGQGEHDLFIRGDSGQVLVWEFNNTTGQVTAGEFLTQSNGTSFTIDTATSIIGTGSNLLGYGGQDILTLNANLTVTMTEFNSSGVEITSGTLTYQGRALTDDAATKFVGTNGTNFLGQGGNDLFFRATSGQLLVWEVASGTTQIVAGEFLVQANGTPFMLDSATTVASVGHDSADGSSAITLKYANGSTALLDVSSAGVVTAAPAGGLLDPLVLNLSGGTVQTTAMAGSGVTFDMVGDGGTQQTGWITQGEGFLVADPSNAPIVSRAQMFSDLLVPGAGSGLAALAIYDTNGDGKITAADSDFGDIKVWVPGAGGSAGSLYGLNQLGITGIDLQPTAIGTMNNGNEILNGFSFQYANGKTGQGAEVGFVAGPDIDPVSTTLTQLVQAMAGLPSSGATLNMPLLAANDQSLQSLIAAHH